MSDNREHTHDDLAVVLTGGGARAAYQVGVLRGVAERLGRAGSFPIVTGVSAGAINAAGLAAGAGALTRTIDRLEKAWLGLSIPRGFDTSVFKMLGTTLRWGFMLATRGTPVDVQARSILDTRPLRKTLGEYITTKAIDANLAKGRLTALGLTATNYASGRTTTFVHGRHDQRPWQRAGRLGVPARIDVDHVLASSALPLIFPAVPIQQQFFGDGSIRQTTPLAPAIHLGARRLLAIGIRHDQWTVDDARQQFSGYPPPAQVIGMVFNSIFLDALNADAERLERINRTLRTLPPDYRHPEGLRPLRLVVVKPSRDLAKLAVDLFHELPQSLRFLLRGLGVRELRSPDMLSYLLFERPYIERLIALGFEDARAQWSRIETVLDPGSAGVMTG